jgi:hypothetical protein
VEATVPTLVVTAVASGTAMALTFNFLPFLQYLLTSPILIFGRRKRKGFGVVYNALTKTPIDLAIVRLFRLKDQDDQKGRLTVSRVTDKGGRYFFLVQPGLYRLEVTKSSYLFPTKYLGQMKEDGAFLDLYHGEIIEVKDADVTITANIPLDPGEDTSAAKLKHNQHVAVVRSIQHFIAAIGVLAAFIALVVRPEAISYLIFAVQVFVYLVSRRLARPHKPKSWGIVYDQKTGRPLSRVIARIFDPHYNKLLDSVITDAKGRYSFLLGPSAYYATFDKEGFATKEVKPIDLTRRKEPIDLALDIHLSQKEAGKG